MQEKKIAALFDFDGTITRSSSSLAFLRNFLGKRYYLYFSYMMPTLLRYHFRSIDIDRLNSHMISTCMKGYTKDELFAAGQKYVNTMLPSLIRPDAIAKLRAHQANGDRCVLVTASYDIYINEWAKQQKFDDVLCTKVQFDKNNIATGAIDGISCSGQEKIKQIKTIIKPTDYIIYAYGDSDGDKEMLAYANHPFYKFFKD